MHTIHIEWSGPLTRADIASLTGAEDYGIYQVYGPSITYKRIELLYIGMANMQTFAVRIAQHLQFDSASDPSQISIYVGRLIGNSTPENAVWKKQIELAEGLLIYAHYPPYNRQKDSIASKVEFPDLRVLNWGTYRDLFQEVSGERQSKMPEMIRYGSENIAFDSTNSLVT